MSRRSRVAAKADFQILLSFPQRWRAEIALRRVPPLHHGRNLASFRRQWNSACPRRMLKRFVYVLKTEPGLRATTSGSPSNVQQRLSWHNQGRCTHTAKHRPWRTHVVVEFHDEAHATRFERYLKSGSGRAFAERHFDSTGFDVQPGYAPERDPAKGSMAASLDGNSRRRRAARMASLDPLAGPAE